jgi:hypothetical protein
MPLFLVLYAIELIQLKLPLEVTLSITVYDHLWLSPRVIKCRRFLSLFFMLVVLQGNHFFFKFRIKLPPLEEQTIHALER